MITTVFFGLLSISNSKRAFSQSVADECKDFFDFKESNADSELMANPALKKEFLGHYAKCFNLEQDFYIKEFNEKISQWDVTYDQKQAFIALYDEFAGEISFSFDDSTENPWSISLNWESNSKETGEASSYFLSLYWSFFEDTLGIRVEDSFEEMIRENEGEFSPSGGTAIFKRFFDEIPVEGDRIILEFLWDDKQENLSLSGISIHFYRDLYKYWVPVSYAKNQNEVLETVQAFGRVLSEPYLTYITFTKEPELAYKSVVAIHSEESDTIEYEIYIRAVDGSFLAMNQVLANYTYQGRAKAKFTNPRANYSDPNEPWNGGTKKNRSVPYIVISDTWKTTTVTVRNVCYYGSPGNNPPDDCTSLGLPPTRQETIYESNTGGSYPAVVGGYQGEFSKNDDDPTSSVDNDRAWGHGTGVDPVSWTL